MNVIKQSPSGQGGKMNKQILEDYIDLAKYRYMTNKWVCCVCGGYSKDNKLKHVGNCSVAKAEVLLKWIK